MDKRQKIQNEIASRVIDACGKVGDLDAVDNNKLEGDIKVRHQKAMEESKKCKSQNEQDDPHVHAIFARIYGLI